MLTPMTVRPLINVTCVRDCWARKALSPILVIVEGTMIDFKMEPPVDSNILSPISVNPLSKVTDFKEFQSPKALAPDYY